MGTQALQALGEVDSGRAAARYEGTQLVTNGAEWKPVVLNFSPDPPSAVGAGQGRISILTWPSGSFL